MGCINFLLNILSGIIGGIIAGFIVYFIIEFKDKRDWNKAKIMLINLFNRSLNHSLTIFRELAAIEPPYRITDDKQYLSYIKKEFGTNCEILSEKIKNNLNRERYKLFLYNIEKLQEEIKYLLILFLSFKKSDRWYVENIIEFKNLALSVPNFFLAFPEISDPNYQNDLRIQAFKNQAINDAVRFCNFVINLKENKKIQDFIKNN